eukprot:9374881-Pyramimonas_sp.AAC.1
MEGERRTKEREKTSRLDQARSITDAPYDAIAAKHTLYHFFCYHAPSSRHITAHLLQRYTRRQHFPSARLDSAPSRRPLQDADRQRPPRTEPLGGGDARPIAGPPRPPPPDDRGAPRPATP